MRGSRQAEVREIRRMLGQTQRCLGRDKAAYDAVLAVLAAWLLFLWVVGTVWWLGFISTSILNVMSNKKQKTEFGAVKHEFMQMRKFMQGDLQALLGRLDSVKGVHPEQLARLRNEVAVAMEIMQGDYNTILDADERLEGAEERLAALEELKVEVDRHGRKFKGLGQVIESLSSRISSIDEAIQRAMEEAEAGAGGGSNEGLGYVLSKLADHSELLLTTRQALDKMYPEYGLKDRVISVEGRLQDRNSDLKDLRYDLDKLSGQVEKGRDELEKALARQAIPMMVTLVIGGLALGVGILSLVLQ
jgi:DNA repair exonuclease SbcCD ATPase subunit